MCLGLWYAGEPKLESGGECLDLSEDVIERPITSIENDSFTPFQSELQASHRNQGVNALKPSTLQNAGVPQQVARAQYIARCSIAYLKLSCGDVAPESVIGLVI